MPWRSAGGAAEEVDAAFPVGATAPFPAAVHVASPADVVSLVDMVIVVDMAAVDMAATMAVVDMAVLISGSAFLMLTATIHTVMVTIIRTLTVPAIAAATTIKPDTGILTLAATPMGRVTNWFLLAGGDSRFRAFLDGAHCASGGGFTHGAR